MQQTISDFLPYAMKFTKAPKYAPSPKIAVKVAPEAQKPAPTTISIPAAQAGLEIILEALPRVGDEIRVKGWDGVVTAVAQLSEAYGAFEVKYKSGKSVETYRIQAPEPKLS